MFDIRLTETGEVALSGRFDGTQVDKVKAICDKLTGTTFVDFRDLSYISSAGLVVLMATQRRLVEQGHGLKLKNVPPRIHEIFKIARFDLIFEIE
jgi:anti-sigma B factor antagonist